MVVESRNFLRGLPRPLGVALVPQLPIRMSDSPKTLKSPPTSRTISFEWVSLRSPLTRRQMSVFSVHAQVSVIGGRFYYMEDRSEGRESGKSSPGIRVITGPGEQM